MLTSENSASSKPVNNGCIRKNHPVRSSQMQMTRNAKNPSSPPEMMYEDTICTICIRKMKPENTFLACGSVTQALPNYCSLQAPKRILHHTALVAISTPVSTAHVRRQTGTKDFGTSSVAYMRLHYSNWVRHCFSLPLLMGHCSCVPLPSSHVYAFASV